MKKDWQISVKIKKDKDISQEEIIKVLLENRGLKTKKEIDRFLNPLSPYDIPLSRTGIKGLEIKKVILRIKKAIKAKELVLIYGDYDADGITASAVLWETLHKLGVKVLPFIPHREKHGYGLSVKGLKSVLEKKDKPGLVITVDNGIVAYKGAEYLKKNKIDLIITDHHQPPEKLPEALAVVHSTEVAGVGVAWFLSREIHKSFKKNLKGFKASNSLELACLGTVTDMMPMLGVNRSLVRFGLKELAESNRAGIKALCSQTGVEQTEIDTYHLGFIIGPRLNAMGRLDEAIDSLRLLCTLNDKRAVSLASKLGLVNRQRQNLTEASFEHARSLAKKKFLKDKLLFIASSSYNQGVIGLVAGKLAEEFYRPSVVLAKEKKYSKGSARSISGFNIFKALEKLKFLFEDLGGHPMAAGFTVKTKNLKALEKKLLILAKKEIKGDLLIPKVKADMEIDLKQANFSLFDQIEKFAPFGIANSRPVFVSKGVEVVALRTVGRDNSHLKLKFKIKSSKKNDGFIEAIAFSQGKKAKELSIGKKVNVCFSLDKNVWNNKKSLQLKVKDIAL